MGPCETAFKTTIKCCFWCCFRCYLHDPEELVRFERIAGTQVRHKEYEAKESKEVSSMVVYIGYPAKAFFNEECCIKVDAAVANGKLLCAERI